ncbi:hypothetical protein [Asticcacaulis sp. W401b]|uniref:hypothetical protein n=1 Tax=Asticcacaulis sp. W401b TaxID=3388666 RepID=UPI0039709861
MQEGVGATLTSAQLAMLIDGMDWQQGHVLIVPDCVRASGESGWTSVFVMAHSWQKSYAVEAVVKIGTFCILAACVAGPANAQTVCEAVKSASLHSATGFTALRGAQDKSELWYTSTFSVPGLDTCTIEAFEDDAELTCSRNFTTFSAAAAHADVIEGLVRYCLMQEKMNEEIWDLRPKRKTNGRTFSRRATGYPEITVTRSELPKNAGRVDLTFAPPLEAE